MYTYHIIIDGLCFRLKNLMLWLHTVTHSLLYLGAIHVAWPSDYEHRASSGRDAFALQSSSDSGYFRDI